MLLKFLSNLIITSQKLAGLFLARSSMLDFISVTVAFEITEIFKKAFDHHLVLLFC